MVNIKWIIIISFGHFVPFFKNHGRCFAMQRAIVSLHRMYCSSTMTACEFCSGSY